MYQPSAISVPAPIAVGLGAVIQEIGLLPVAVNEGGEFEYAYQDEFAGTVEPPFTFTYNGSEVARLYERISRRDDILKADPATSPLLREKDEMDSIVTGTFQAALDDASLLEDLSAMEQEEVRRAQEKFSTVEVHSLMSILGRYKDHNLRCAALGLANVLHRVARLASSDDRWDIHRISRLIGKVDEEKSARYHLLAGAVSMGIGTEGELGRAEMAFFQSSRAYLSAGRFTAAAMMAEYAAIARDRLSIEGTYRNPYRDLAHDIWTVSFEKASLQDPVGHHVAWFRALQNAASGPYPNARSIGMLYLGMAVFIKQHGEPMDVANHQLRGVAWLLKESRITGVEWFAIEQVLSEAASALPEHEADISGMAQAAASMNLPAMGGMAMDLYRPTHSDRKSGSEFYANEARRSFEDGAMDWAVGQYKDAFFLSGDPAHLVNRGVSLYMDGNYGEAGNCFKQAVVLGADEAEVFGNLGMSLVFNGRAQLLMGAFEPALDAFREAAAVFNIALERDGENTKYLSHRAATNLALGKFKSAIRDFKAAARMNPSDIETKYHLSAAYASMNLNHTAIDVLDDAIAQEPYHPTLFGLRSEIRLKLGDMAEALADAKQAVLLDPLDSRNWRTLRQAALESSDGRRA